MAFKAGYDPNRYNPKDHGITAFHDKLAELVRAQCLDAAGFIHETLMNESESTKLRLVAAKEILDRGMGRPVDVQVVRTVSSEKELKDVGSMSDSELETLARSLSPIPTRGAKSEIIEAEFTKSE